MDNTFPHISVIILNWNGWQDTIECLETVLKNNYQNYHILVIDNFSEDDSIARIRQWATGDRNMEIKTSFSDLVYPLVKKPVRLFEMNLEANISLEEQLANQSWKNIPLQSVVLIKNFDNSGFAIGNNLGIKIAEYLFENQFIFLLNNDTVVDRDCIVELLNDLISSPDLGLSTAAIYFYDNPDKVSNLGGKISFFGNRKYYTSASRSGALPVTFVTGCALMVKGEIFKKYGLLSEKFFFGEEDFEYSLRMKKNKVKMSCSPNSIVYHKVNVSSEKLYKENQKKMVIYYFNRIINMKSYFPYLLWVTWKNILIFYSLYWFRSKAGVNFKKALKLSRYLYFCSKKYLIADKQTSLKIYQDLSL
jgi:hypothetical protein